MITYVYIHVHTYNRILIKNMFELKAWPLFLLSKEYKVWHLNNGTCKMNLARNSTKKDLNEVHICLFMYIYVCKHM
jgi:hypothetical protein